MSYLVLARKYRPQSFEEVIGQDHITGLLAKAIESDRIPHAYLFCGPRGIGKTSCARILAKSLNCAEGPTLKPCGACPACREIAAGTSFDVLEIDGASNRGIDEIRTLRENVKFAPSYGRYKIYIVDEVHMLTTEAFNALLKTLEEPPAHVKFILATTAPHKVPATIISRCQRFDFKRISVKTTAEAMEGIIKKEKLKADPDALYAIAKASDGSLRDALSILDQLSALGEEGIKVDDVSAMLGVVETQFLFDVTEALSRKDCTAALELLERILDDGKDIKQLVKDLIEHFRNLMIVKVGGKTLGKMIDHPIAIKEMYLTQCRQFSLQKILLAIDTLIEAQETARVTEFVCMPLEVAFAKLTYQAEPVGPVVAESLPGISSEFQGALRNAKDPIDLSPEDPAEEETAVVGDNGKMAVSSAGEEALDLEKIKRCWDTLTHAVSREKMSVATYLQEGTPIGYKAGKVDVGFPKKCVFQKEALEDANNRRIVEKIFAEKLGVAVAVHYAILDDCGTKDEEEIVKNALQTFKGKVVSRWHNE